MALENITRHQTGLELFRLFRGIFADVNRQITEYNRIKAIDPIGARKCIITALSKPKLVKQRVAGYIAEYTSDELTASINQVTDGVTIAELNTEVTAMDTYCQVRYNAYISETETLDDIADALLVRYENILLKTTFPIPPGATDIEGEPY